MNIKFLEIDKVKKFHKKELDERFGKEGIRSESLLDSAVNAPQASFFGEYLYNDIYEMASAYLYFISENQPFIDGNKRAAVASCIMFLKINSLEIIATKEDLFNLVIDLASNQEKTTELIKTKLADFFRKNTRPNPLSALDF